MLACNGYFPLITLPTRVNDVSSTLIDHLITNDHKNSIFPGIICCIFPAASIFVVMCQVCFTIECVITSQSVISRISDLQF